MDQYPENQLKKPLAKSQSLNALMGTSLLVAILIIGTMLLNNPYC